MEHLEIHTIESHADLETAIAVGLLTPAEEYYCDHCEEEVAQVTTKFYPFAVILDEDDSEWLVCMECASPVITPATLR